MNPPSTKRVYTSTQSADCDDCDWTTQGTGSLGRAARHHDATGHQVLTMTTVKYERLPNPDQTALDVGAPA